jgi:SNF2 family DNA or RNA helicase
MLSKKHKIYAFKTKPYQHQYHGWDMAKDREEFAWFMEMGTGKSKICVDNFCWLYDQGKIDTVLIVAPKGVYRNWANIEVAKHAPTHIDYSLVAWENAPSKGNKVYLDRILQPADKLRILVMNIEAFSTQKGFKFAALFVKSGRNFIAVDESTTIKSPRAGRTKSIIQLGKYSKYRRILSGLPNPNSPMDLYTQCVFLDEHLLGFTSYYSFRNRYATMIKMNCGGRAFSKVVGYQRLDELEDLLSKFSFRVLKKDCLDLPEKVYVTRSIELTADQQKHYNSVKDKLRTSVEQGDLTITETLVKLVRLHQISCGNLPLDDGSIVSLDNSRITNLLDIIEEQSGKIVIWATYRKNIEDIVKALTKEHGAKSIVEYHGGVDDAARSRAIDLFQDGDSPVRFFVGNPQTGGMGITLTASSTVIYYSNSYNLEHRLQSEDRTHRIGQAKSVVYIDLVCEGTVDEKIVESLRNKKNMASYVLGDEIYNWI